MIWPQRHRDTEKTLNAELQPSLGPGPRSFGLAGAKSANEDRRSVRRPDRTNPRTHRKTAGSWIRPTPAAPVATRRRRTAKLCASVSLWPRNIRRAQGRPRPTRSSLQPEHEWLLQRRPGPPKEAEAVGTVDHAVIVRKGKRQHQPRHELPAFLAVDRLHARARDAEDGHFRRVDDRREIGPADAAQIRNAETAALHLVECDLAGPRLLRQLRELDRELDDVL